MTKSFSTKTEGEDGSTKVLSLYCWGTSAKGTIPVKEVLEEGRSSSGGSSMLNRSGGTVIDHPREIDLLDAFKIDNTEVSIKDIYCGPTSTGIILSDDTAFTFGSNKQAELGHGHKNDVIVPTLLSPPDSTSLHRDEISNIVLGSKFSAIIDKKGDLYTFGYNGSVLQNGVGCLGLGYEQEYAEVPTLVRSLVEDGCFATDVVVGDSHMVVLTKDGEILTTGGAAWGRLGNLEPDDQAFLEPVELLAAEDICQISGGDEYSLALTSDGVVFAWGKNHKGQCGTGSSMSVDMYAMENMPQPLDGMMEGQHVVKISGGHSHAAAVTDKGELFWWGSQLNLTPELAPNLAHTKIVDVACGKDYTIALDEVGRLYSFGSGKTGVLGLANEKKAVAPTLVEGMLGKKVVKVDAGWSHVACLVEEVDGEGTDNTV